MIGANALQRQTDPDMYVRVVSERPMDRGPRHQNTHSCTPYVDEVIVIPSRSMGPEDEAWSVAFAVPPATPGLRMYASDFLSGGDEFTRPISRSTK